MYCWASPPKKGISRLLVGGLHREESKITEPILRRLEGYEPEEGSVVLTDLGGTTNLSTLDERFLSTDEGKALVSLIEKVRPSLYVELHTYQPSSYWRLTSPHRMSIEGVPPLIELERGVLHASTSPLLRRIFRRDDLCLLLEVPEGSEDVAIELLRGAIDSHTRTQYVGFLRRRYPQQVAAGMRLFEKFYRERFEYP